VVDPSAGEQCDPPDTSACSAGQSCVCCQCLGDGETLGDRMFSIARPPSKFLTSALTGVDVGTGIWLPGPIVITAGRPDPNAEGEAACQAPLTLAHDAIFGFQTIQPGTVCNKLFAEGSIGVIDCDGGTPQNVVFTIDSNGTGPASPPTVCSSVTSDQCSSPEDLGDGTTAGPGAATLFVARLISVNLPSADPAQVCPTLDYEHALSIPGVKPADVIDGPIAFTTNQAEGIVLNPSSGGQTIMLPKMGAAPISGMNFSCATWSQEDSQGAIIGPIPGLDTVIGDTMDAFSLVDAPQ
jgi:hypothetical protein